MIFRLVASLYSFSVKLPPVCAMALRMLMLSLPNFFSVSAMPARIFSGAPLSLRVASSKV